MAITSYTVKSGDRFNPFNGKTMNYPVGTVIYGDYSSSKDYGTSNPNSNSSSNSSSSTQVSSSNLKKGSSGSAVKDLQEKLISLGYNVGSSGADGKFGSATEAAVKEYQKANGLSSDGIVGKNTSSKLNSTVSSSVKQNQTQSQQINEFNPNSGVKMAPGETVKDNATGKYVTQGQYGQTDEPMSQPSISSNYQEDYKKAGDTASSFYNVTERDEWGEKRALTTSEAIGDAAVSSDIISSNFLKTLMADSSVIAFYVNAIAYGGYTIGDVVNDMKRREMISKGNEDAKSIKIIDPELDRTSYQATSDGQNSMKNAANIIPTFDLQGLMDPEILKYGADMPDEVFKTLVPIMDTTSQEFKDAVAEVKATYYNLATAALQATTEQEKAIADYNLKNFKEQINKQYGILLSDDATKAWSQIEGLQDTMSNRGISGSGMEAEGIDTILSATRKQDQRYRDEKLTKEEQEKASYYTTSASAAEIAALTDEERIKYGLKPSPEILQKFSIEALKAQYPNKSDSEIKAIHDSVIDEHGNYRSSLYSKYYGKIADTEISNEKSAKDQVILDAQNKENAAYRVYTNTPDNQFSQATKQDNKQMEKDAEDKIEIPNSNTLTPKASEAASEAAKKVSGSINEYNSNTGNKLKQGETYVNSEGKTVKQGTPVSSSNMSVAPSNMSVASKVTTPNISVAPSNMSVTPSAGSSQYKVVSGDTLSAIAAKNKTTVAALAKLNNISDPNKIKVGQTIKFS